MCNACGNLCCGSDQFEGCGCEGCECPDCWAEEDLDEADDDFGSDSGYWDERFGQ